MARRPPAAAPQILDQLTAPLPARMLNGKNALHLLATENLQPIVRLIGTGHVFVDRAWWEAILTYQDAGREQLALAVASELGHACLGSARRRRQRAWRKEELQTDAERKSNHREIKLAILNRFTGVGTILEHAYTRTAEFQADLFAIQLCRNAGFDVEICLDAIRAAAVQGDGGMQSRTADRKRRPRKQSKLGCGETSRVLSV